MPELPEVETTKCGLTPLIVGKKVSKVLLHRRDLRWEIPQHLSTTLINQTLQTIGRRGKYLLFDFKIGVLIIHLGMSGSIRVVDTNTILKKHEHFELQFGDSSMRLHDPRRFGAVLFSQTGTHRLLDNLGVEPLENAFDESYLYNKSRKKQQNIKAFVMDGKIVVGVGNIYACESLFASGINPQRNASSVSKAGYKRLTDNIKSILLQAIKVGGTTLQDFAKVDGSPGYFAQTLRVYGRENENCTQCDSKIMRVIQNQRSTFYCNYCQK